MKFSDVVPDRFKGPHHQEFSTWLRKVELAFRVTKTDDINKVDHLLAYMDPPAQDIAMQYAETYTRELSESRAMDIVLGAIGCAAVASSRCTRDVPHQSWRATMGFRQEGHWRRQMPVTKILWKNDNKDDEKKRGFRSQEQRSQVEACVAGTKVPAN